ncbi:hypothetical protein LCGC14_2669050, partial [marine sediment metagenome]
STIRSGYAAGHIRAFNLYLSAFGMSVADVLDPWFRAAKWTRFEVHGSRLV